MPTDHDKSLDSCEMVTNDTRGATCSGEGGMDLRSGAGRVKCDVAMEGVGGEG